MIEVRNFTENQVSETFFKKIVQAVLKEERFCLSIKEVELSVALVGPGRMRKLNKAFLKRNRATDVLAFPESKILFEKFKIGTKKKVKGLGEIVICLREVKKNARRFKSSFEKELGRVLIHGLLHLLGYEHEGSNRETGRMNRKEEEYLELLIKD